MRLWKQVQALSERYVFVLKSRSWGIDTLIQIVARGPPVGRPVDEEELPDQWVRLSGQASVQANGTFKVVLI